MLKKTKKTLALLLSTSMMFSGITAMTTASAAATGQNGYIETFDGYGEEGVEGTTLFTGTATKTKYTIGDYIAFEITGVGNSVAIATDPYTGSKALKVVHGGTGDINIYQYYKGHKSKGAVGSTISTECKVRVAGHKNTVLGNFNRIDNNGVTVMGGTVYGEQLAYFSGSNPAAYGESLTGYATTYQQTGVTYNPSTKQAVVKAGSGEKTITGSSEKQPQATRFDFSAPSSGKTSEGWTGKIGDKTEIWLDDMGFDYSTYDVQVSVAGQAGVYKNGTAYTAKTLTDIPLNAPIEVRFTGACADEALNVENYSLKDGSGADVEFTVSRFTDDIITVYPEGQLTSTSYTFTAKSGIPSAANTLIETAAERSVTYSTCADGLGFLGYVASENFNNYADQSFTKEVYNSNNYFLDKKILVTQNVSGDAISVETDPITNNKALKITNAQKVQGSSNKYYWQLPEAYTSGKLVTTADVRMASYEKQSGQFFSFASSTSLAASSTGWINKIESNYWWCNNKIGNLQWTNSGKWQAEKYFPIMMSIDMDSKQFAGEVYRMYTTDSQSLTPQSWSFEDATDCADLKYITLCQFKNSAVPSKEGAVYIDNLRVARYDIMPVQVVGVSKTAEDASVDKEIVITFNDEIDDNYLTDENIVVYKINGEDYEPITGTLAKDGNKVIFTADEYFENEATYSVWVMDVKGKKLSQMTDQFSFDFVTESKKAVEVGANVADGEKDFPYNRDVVLEFSVPVAAPEVVVKKNGQIITDYTTRLSDDKMQLNIEPSNGCWDTESEYRIEVGEVSAENTAMASFAARSFGFTTSKLADFAVSDDFTEFELGQKWAGPGDVTLGNIKVTLLEGDSIEYAVDKATFKCGLKLIKGSSSGSTKFIYGFDQSFSSGKLITKVDSRIQNWSKAFLRWPAMLGDNDKENFSRLTLFGGSSGVNAYYHQTGTYKGTDRYDYQWSAEDGANTYYISAIDVNANNKYVAEVCPGEFYSYGVEKPGTTDIIRSVEPATTEAAYSGILMMMADGGTDYANGYFKGTHVDADTVNNPNNAAIAWIYGITVENESFTLKNTSFENIEGKFTPQDQLTFNFSEVIDKSSVNEDTVKLSVNGTAANAEIEYSNKDKSFTVVPEEFVYSAEYKVELNGIRSKYTGIDGTVTGTFTVNTEDKSGDDYELKNFAVDGLKITADLKNNTQKATDYTVIATALDADGKIVEIAIGSSGSLAAGASVPVEINFKNSGAKHEIFVWESLTTMKPLTKEKLVPETALENQLVFAAGTNRILVDGKLVQTEQDVYMDNDNVVVPASTATRYIVKTSKDLSFDVLNEMGYSTYASSKYNFFVIGNNVNITQDEEDEIIKKFGIYVSNQGNDNNSGLAGTPVATLGKALSIFEGGLRAPIYVKSGEYNIPNGIELSAADNNVTIAAYGDGEVDFCGAITLAGEDFADVTDAEALAKIPAAARANVKQLDLGKYISGDISRYTEYAPMLAATSYYELFADGRAQTVARWPNSGFASLTKQSDNAITVTEQKAELWKNSDTAMIAGYFYNNWAFENIYIDRANTSANTVTLSKTPKYGIKTGNRYYAMNLLEELDAEGEYYIDPSAKILYYYPSSELSSTKLELTATKNDLFKISGASNVTLEGLTVEGTRANGIVAENGENIVIDNCTVKNIGNGGIILNTKNSTVKNSEIHAIGATAVRINAGSNESLTAGNIVVKDNTIHDFGRIFRTYQGAVNMQGCANTFEYNTVYDAPHCAVRFAGSNMKINNNDISKVVYECSDAGVIYAGRSWNCWNNLVDSNYIHDISKAEGLDSFSVAAVYCDDQLTGTSVTGNLIKNCPRAALFGGGSANSFSGNIVVDCETGVQYDDRGRTYQAKSAVADDDDTSDTIYEAFVKFLANPGVVATLQFRKDNHRGFKELAADVESYKNNPNYEMGHPKNAIVTNNAFYGAHVNDADYQSIAADVKAYGTVENNTYSVSGFRGTDKQYGVRQ